MGTGGLGGGLARADRGRSALGVHRSHFVARALGDAAHALAPLIIDAEDGSLGRLFPSKKLRLGLEVVLHCGVKIEVVLAQVRKPAYRKPSSAHASQLQRMRGHFHHHVGNALVLHAREKLL